VTHDDQPTHEPMRKPDVPPANRSPRRMHRRGRGTGSHRERALTADDSPYLETVDRLAEMDRTSWIDRVRERKNRRAE
jgi:hypothetical protein